MTNKFVYLAGPIAGTTRSEANDWRKEVQDAFIDGIIGISPLRCEPLIKERYDDAMAFAEGSGQYQDKRFGTPDAIANKNELDMRSCDLTLAYLPMEISARRPSYGTVAEIAWAKILHKPCILVTDDPGVYNHPVIMSGVGWHLDTFEDAVDTIHGLFGDYVTPPMITVGRDPGYYQTMGEGKPIADLPTMDAQTRSIPEGNSFFGGKEI